MTQEREATMPDEQTLRVPGQISPLPEIGDERDTHDANLIGWKLTRQRGIRDGANVERARIVAWLRAEFPDEWYDNNRCRVIDSEALDTLANAIKKGEHDN